MLNLKWRSWSIYNNEGLLRRIVMEAENPLKMPKTCKFLLPIFLHRHSLRIDPLQRMHQISWVAPHKSKQRPAADKAACWSVDLLHHQSGTIDGVWECKDKAGYCEKCWPLPYTDRINWWPFLWVDRKQEDKFEDTVGWDEGADCQKAYLNYWKG